MPDLPQKCDHCGDDSSLYMHSRCHTGSPTWAVLSGDVLTIECAECKKPITRFVVSGIADETAQIKPTLFVEITRRPDRKMETRIGMNDINPAEFGMLLCDILRHGAKAFKIEDELIWEWVDRERNNPTTPIYEVKPN